MSSSHPAYLDSLFQTIDAHPVFADPRVSRRGIVSQRGDGKGKCALVAAVGFDALQRWANDNPGENAEAGIIYMGRCGFEFDTGYQGWYWHVAPAMRLTRDKRSRIFVFDNLSQDGVRELDDYKTRANPREGIVFLTEQHIDLSRQRLAARQAERAMQLRSMTLVMNTIPRQRWDHAIKPLLDSVDRLHTTGYPLRDEPLRGEPDAGLPENTTTPR